MVRLQAFLALLTGFATMLAIGLAVIALLRRFAPQLAEPDQKLSPVYVFVNLASSFFAAAAGGFVTAWAAAEDNALRDVLALAIVILVLGAISALLARKPQQQGAGMEERNQPVWYQMMFLVLSSLGVVAGGLLRLRAAGIL